MTDRHDNLATLKRGETRVVAGKLYCRCADCGKIGRVDGWLGGLHFCVGDNVVTK